MRHHDAELDGDVSGSWFMFFFCKMKAFEMLSGGKPLQPAGQKCQVKHGRETSAIYLSS